MFNPKWNEFINKNWSKFKDRWSSILNENQINKAQFIVDNYQSIQDYLSDKNLTF